MKPLSILVVDDMRETVDVVTDCLKSSGHDVTGAAGGKLALCLLRDRRFDVVITDVLMPEVDGVEVIMAARRFQPGAQVVVMSGGGEFFTKQELLRLGRMLGAVEQLAKPFSRADMLATVERVTGPSPALAGAA